MYRCLTAPHGEIATPAASTDGQTTICRLLLSAFVTNNVYRSKNFENAREPFLTEQRLTKSNEEIRKEAIASFHPKKKQILASFGLASFEFASFGIASFEIASFVFGDFRAPRRNSTTEEKNK
jgi:patatin-like phospholipase/acyl hydrolase